MYANDRRLLKGLRKDDLVPVINENSEKLNQYKKLLFVVKILECITMK